MEFVRMWSSREEEFLVTRVCRFISCLTPFSEQNSLYRLIPLGVSIWLLAKFILKSPGIYI